MPDETAAPPWGHAAVLVWVAPAAMPDAQALDGAHAHTPPHPNPVPFWRFSDAVEHATETLKNGRHSGKEPWIKTGQALFGPLEVAAFYRVIQGMRGH
jgi:hypothetical protein